MIAEAPNINRCIANDRYAEILFDKLRVTFSSSSLKKIKALGLILESDGITFIVKRTTLWRWKLIMEIPILAKYNEDEYQNIQGKFFLLASRCFVHLVTTLLIG